MTAEDHDTPMADAGFDEDPLAVAIRDANALAASRARLQSPDDERDLPRPPALDHGAMQGLAETAAALADHADSYKRFQDTRSPPVEADGVVSPMANGSRSSHGSMSGGSMRSLSTSSWLASSDSSVAAGNGSPLSGSSGGVASASIGQDLRDLLQLHCGKLRGESAGATDDSEDTSEATFASPAVAVPPPPPQQQQKQRSTTRRGMLSASLRRSGGSSGGGAAPGATIAATGAAPAASANAESQGSSRLASLISGLNPATIAKQMLAKRRSSSTAAAAAAAAAAPSAMSAKPASAATAEAAAALSHLSSSPPLAPTELLRNANNASSSGNSAPVALPSPALHDDDDDEADSAACDSSVAPDSENLTDLQQHSGSSKSSKWSSRSRGSKAQQQSAGAAGSNPRRWTVEEDERLRRAVQQVGDRRWKDIAAIVGTRDNVQCLQRWRKSLKPGLRKGPWLPEEDEVLRQRYAEKQADPSLTWSWVASQVEGRNAKQCRERWQNFLDDSIKRGGWTPEEDALLARLHAEMNGRWATIARHMPGRTENSVKVRFQSMKRLQSRAAQRRTAAATAADKSDPQTHASGPRAGQGVAAGPPAGATELSPHEKEGLEQLRRMQEHEQTSSQQQQQQQRLKRPSLSPADADEIMAACTAGDGTAGNEALRALLGVNGNGVGRNKKRKSASVPPEMQQQFTATVLAAAAAVSSPHGASLEQQQQQAVAGVLRGTRHSAPPSAMHALSQALQLTSSSDSSRSDESTPPPLHGSGAVARPPQPQPEQEERASMSGSGLRQLQRSSSDMSLSSSFPSMDALSQSLGGLGGMTSAAADSAGAPVPSRGPGVLSQDQHRALCDHLATQQQLQRRLEQRGSMQ